MYGTNAKELRAQKNAANQQVAAFFNAEHQSEISDCALNDHRHQRMQLHQS